MRVLHFDPFFGVSGDMIIAALVDLGVPVAYLEKQIRKLGFSRLKIQIREVRRQTIGAKQVSFRFQSRLTVDRFIPALARSGLSPYVKHTGIQIIKRILAAEAQAHRRKRPQLHELADLDTLIDVAGALLAIEALKVEAVSTSALKAGKGYVGTAHGKMPAFNFATAYLLKGMPVEILDVEGELVTPTGAAILSTVARPAPGLKLDKILAIGHGAGSREEGHYPNLLRVFLGQAKTGHYDVITMLETNLDDQNPQIFDYLFDRLFEAGALDVYLTPTIQKKSRPGLILSVIARRDDVEELLSMIFIETSTLGIRIAEVERRVLERKIRSFNSSYGRIRYKVRKIGEGERMTLEYDDLKKIARRRGLPLARLNEAILREFNLKAIK